ncbi:hypothetical protein H312_02467 [Anncaliia algerae PRA339]|uniref:Small GTP-binding protein domain n=1 Tax=Anncaliia algerae PRA339 TaxID=1288291 RepID=A0A059EZ03_9MICR|nr:hypothetical protein H312_02467 [Anncaliia algerae PRA339]
MAAPIEIEKQVVMVGYGGSGKTCLLHRSFSNTFVEQYIPTVFEDTRICRIINNKKISLLILDTAGQDDYGRMVEINLSDADCVVFCYAVNSRDSFEAVTSRYYDLLPNKPDQIKFLIGCKIDTREEGEVVSTQEGIELAKKIGAKFFSETSSKNGNNCKEIFDEIFNIYGKSDIKLKKDKKKRSFMEKFFGYCGCGK